MQVDVGVATCDRMCGPSVWWESILSTENPRRAFRFGLTRGPPTIGSEIATGKIHSAGNGAKYDYRGLVAMDSTGKTISCRYIDK